MKSQLYDLLKAKEIVGNIKGQIKNPVQCVWEMILNGCVDFKKINDELTDPPFFVHSQIFDFSMNQTIIRATEIIKS